MKQPTPITLSNQYVTLIPMTMAHLQDFYNAGHDEKIWQWTPPYQCENLTTAEQWLTTSLLQVAKNEQVMFGIIDNASGQFVGSTRYCCIDTDNSSIEIGFTFVNPKFQRSSVNTNSKLLLLTHAFEALGAVRVQLRTHEKNQKSRNAISRLGATFEGILRSHTLLSTGEYRNTALFSLLRDEWPAAKARLQERTSQHLALIKNAQQKQPSPQIDDEVKSIIKEYALAQVMIASHDNLHDQIIYLPLCLDVKNKVLTGHLFNKNKMAWLLENSPNVTITFQAGDGYISPLLHEKINVPTWNYRRLHISGQFRFLPTEQNKDQIRQQVEALESGHWSMDEQPEKMMNAMLANIRCFTVSIDRINKEFKLDLQKPLAVREAIAQELSNTGQTSFAKAHLK